MTEKPERTSRQVWVLGSKVLAVQLITLVLLWWMQATFAGG